MKITIAQIDVIIGDIQANFAKIIDIYKDACANNSDIVIFPELALCGSLMQDAMLYFEMRDKRVMKAEESANKLPTKMTLGTMLFTLPPLLVILIGPSLHGITKMLGAG